MENKLTKLEKRFIMFKFFLSMNKIYLNHDLEEQIKYSFYSVLNNNVSVDAPDEYYQLLLNTIEESKNIYSGHKNYSLKIDNAIKDEIADNTPDTVVSDNNILLLDKYSKHKP